jgi:enoyl-CoA hydratase/carnithine racemase
MNDEPILLREPTPWGVRLTLNRPAKLNALNAELRDTLTEAIADAAADERVRVIAIDERLADSVRTVDRTSPG